MPRTSQITSYPQRETAFADFSLQFFEQNTFSEWRITIQKIEKTYYNQKNVISEIHNRTGCSPNEIAKVLNSLGDFVKEKFSDKDDYVEIKLFPGLKVTSKYITPEQSKSNLDISGLHFVLSLSAAFSDYFKKEIRNMHSKNI